MDSSAYIDKLNVALATEHVDPGRAAELFDRQTRPSSSKRVKTGHRFSELTDAARKLRSGMARAVLWTVVILFWSATRSLAVEGSAAAGPIGGTDLRSAQLPPPGFYGITALVYGQSWGFNDARGNSIGELRDLLQTTRRAGAAFLFVPDYRLFSGALGLIGVLPGGEQCGRLVVATGRRCITGFADPYFELNWSRFFGSVRPSQFEGAYPILEGLTVQLGAGALVPIGRYSVGDARTYGVTLGDNIWDFAPLAAFTYMTPPIFAEGTEVSAKAYWNNYITNPDTNYRTGSLLNVDFALTERVGRFQFGLAGTYIAQLEDDELSGIKVLPDGRRADVLSLGLVGVYDMPEFASSVKVKWLSAVKSQNTPNGFGISLSYVQKLN